MSKHTPGPWKAHFEEAYFVTGPDLGRVAMMMNLKGAHGLCGRRSGYESAANARLIAAAPDLLEAAKLVIAWYEAEEDHSKANFYQRMQMCGDAEAACRAAIAKATNPS